MNQIAIMESKIEVLCKQLDAKERELKAEKLVWAVKEEQMRDNFKRCKDAAEYLKAKLALNAKMLARQCDLAREAETQALRLRCCGNCKYNHVTNIDTYCEITGEEVNGHKVCAKWQSDGKKRKDRE